MEKQSKSKTEVFHFDLYGKRDEKYNFLNNNSLKTIEWNTLEPNEPNFFLVKKDFNEIDDYEKGFKLDILFKLYASGIKTQRDDASIKFTKNECDEIKMDFLTLSNDELARKYNFKDVRDWTISEARKDLKENTIIANKLCYRPFDFRYMNYTGKTKGVQGYPRLEVMKHFLSGKNFGIILNPQPQAANINLFESAYITNKISDTNMYRRGGPCTFPLYIYPASNLQKTLEHTTERTPNLNPEIVKQIAEKLGLSFTPEKSPHSPPLEGCPTGGVASSPPLEGCPTGGVASSPPLEGCPKDGVANNPKTILTTINNTPIIRNFVENLPFNPALKKLVKEKRKAGILSEVLFWQQVHKGKFHNIDFDRQRIIGNYIVDFYVKALGLVIEVDGSSHINKADYDAQRQAYLENLGLNVFRIPDSVVKTDIQRVMCNLETYIIGKYGGNEKEKSFNTTSAEMKSTPVFDHPSKGGECSSIIPGSSTSSGEFAPIDILDYIYAVLHSPTYREKYKEFLKIDFPRVPYPKDKDTFWQLVKLGGEIRQIHLLESPTVEKYITQYPIDGSNEVEKPVFLPSPPLEGCPQGGVVNNPPLEGCPQGGVVNNPPLEGCPQGGVVGKVYINETQYFDHVPQIAWDFYIGGYQPAQKWLKDRKGRKLEFEDILHYQKIIVALSETDRLMKEIDGIEIE